MHKRKIVLKKLAKCFGKSPTDNATRETNYNQRKYYRKLTKSKKESYKTAVMVFNRSERQLKDSLTFKFEDTAIPSAREYCYLGVSFSLKGTLRPAQDRLRQKGLRSYFALKRMLDLRGLRTSVLF